MVEQDVLAPQTMVDFDKLNPTDQDVLALARPTVVETSATSRRKPLTSERVTSRPRPTEGFDTPRRSAPHRLNQRQTMVEQDVPHTMVDFDKLNPTDQDVLALARPTVRRNLCHITPEAAH
ncbi:hypothetical protein, partial [Gordonia desulfuricans]|uniref:hypothetical protein n=1 Tax=Gordonia desulfuricans TaxID=89051 RepID=UPI001EE48E4B